MQYKPPLPKGIPIPIPAMRPPRGSISPLANAFFTSTFLEFKLILFLTEIKTSTLLVLQLAFYTSEQKYRHGWVRAAGRARKSLSWKESPRQPALHKPTFMTMNICMCHSHQFSFQWKHTFSFYKTGHAYMHQINTNWGFKMVAMTAQYTTYHTLLWIVVLCSNGCFIDLYYGIIVSNNVITNVNHIFTKC